MLPPHQSGSYEWLNISEQLQVDNLYVKAQALEEQLEAIKKQIDKVLTRARVRDHRWQKRRG